MAIEFSSAPGAARGEDGELRAELLAIVEWAGDNVVLVFVLLAIGSLILTGAYSHISGRKRDPRHFSGGGGAEFDSGGDGGGGD